LETKNAILDTSANPAGDDASNSGVDTVGPRRAIERYDFERRARFSRRQIRALQDVHEHAAELISERLSGCLGVSTQVELESIAETALGGFLDSLPSPAAVCVFTVAPLPRKGLLFVDLDSAFCFIDRLLGGPGNGNQESRPLTNLEQVVIGSALAAITEALCKSWRHLVECTAAIERVETEKRFLNVGLQSDQVLVAVFKVSARETVGQVQISLPANTIDPLVEDLASASMAMDRETDPQFHEQLKELIHESVTDVVAQFNLTNIPVRDILSLQVGDIIRMDHDVRSPVCVQVNGIDKFGARPGLAGNRRAAQIT